MLLDLLPLSVRKYFEMSKRQRKHEMQMTIWYMPALYITLAIISAIITLILDLTFEVNQYMPDFLQIHADSTRILVSTLIGGILTLSAFTLNSLLVVLTTFSGQFSPRMLLNFVEDRKTQHAIGIFNGNFVYVLVVFLFIGNSGTEQFSAIPVVTIFLAFLSAITFIYFINHATMWMQVHNITYTMKKSSEEIINKTLKEDIEAFRTEDPGSLLEEYKEQAQIVRAVKSGYLQIVDYRRMIEEAQKDNIIVQLHAQVGDYILKGNDLVSYWGEETGEVDHMKYCHMIEIGHKETELQDIQMGMHKLAEIAIKSLGNDDPKTATDTIHKMAELMLTVEDYITFTPYLTDHDHQVRVILQEESFQYYIYRGFGYIRHYAKDNHLIITEMVKSLAMIAQSISPSKHQLLWEFACNTLDHIEREVIYELDKTFLLNNVKKLALITDNILDYYAIEEKFYPQHV
ncbi:DUF2254 domain-containing protein [Halobacillus fulvus]|nr:DUF2254 domain-containing protein [Halobacillus fulvus]